MNRIAAVSIVVALIGVCDTGLSTAIAQGSLSPPGAPAPTMKTLDQVEPRTPITALPFEITASGSYYLVTNLTGSAGTNGITIKTSDVTLDLRGFALSGVGGSLDGIHIGVSAAHTNIVVRNGTVRNWGDDGVDGLNGVNCLFENLTLANNNAYGIFAGSDSTIISCLARSNGGRGIRVNNPGSILRCTATFNGTDGIFGAGICSECLVERNGGAGFNGSGEFRQCHSSQNGGVGFLFTSSGIANGCRAVNNGAAGFLINNNPPNDSLLVNCIASGNTNAGISCSGSAAVVKDCIAQGNFGHGISTGTGSAIIGCEVRDNTTNGINAGVSCFIKDCIAISNDNDGINASDGSRVTGCQAGLNTGDGIQVGASCQVTDNNCYQNGISTGDGAGIVVTGISNQIEGNHAVLNDRGIDVNSAANTIIRNSARNNTGSGSPSANFDITGANALGTIVLTEGALNLATNANVNIGF